MTAFDDRPPRLGVTIAALAAMVAVLASLPGHAFGVALVAAGAVLLSCGAAYRARSVATVGVAAAFLGFLLQAVLGTGPVAPLVGLAAAVVAWDVGDHAIGLGEQVGRAARSRQAVLAHAVGSGAVAAAVVTVGVVLFQVAPSSRPFAALLFLLLAAVLLPLSLHG